MSGEAYIWVPHWEWWLGGQIKIHAPGAKSHKSEQIGDTKQRKVLAMYVWT